MVCADALSQVKEAFGGLRSRYPADPIVARGRCLRLQRGPYSLTLLKNLSNLRPGSTRLQPMKMKPPRSPASLLSLNVLKRRRLFRPKRRFLLTISHLPRCSSIPEAQYPHRYPRPFSSLRPGKYSGPSSLTRAPSFHERLPSHLSPFLLPFSNSLRRLRLIAFTLLSPNLLILSLLPSLLVPLRWRYPIKPLFLPYSQNLLLLLPLAPFLSSPRLLSPT